MSADSKNPSSNRRKKSRYIWDKQSIRALRDHLGYTQREMADELEVRQQTISEWETGIHTPHRSTQKTLSLVAERAGFTYSVTMKAEDAAQGEDPHQP